MVYNFKQISLYAWNRMRLTAVMIFFSWLLHGQANQLVQHSLELDSQSDTLISGPNTIVPESVILFPSEGVEYKVDNNVIQIKSESAASLLVSYRTLNINLGESAAIMDENDLNKKSKIIKIANDYSAEEDLNRRLIESNKLKYTGSFTRGVNMGNTQDVVLQSDFNIQMEGDLGNGLGVRAAISDENIPIQPQGNTQVLQEFDKVFIELTKDRTSVIAGDYELGRPEGYFMNYYKKLKGLSVYNESRLNENWELSNRGSFAISRGKFRRLELETREGNQGPYKLLGENNELFLQVLSGTEKIYADGRLLRRGENFDYVIDYNRAELRFTPQMIITTNIRIICEYEYATQEYLRSLYATETKLTNGNLDVVFNFYNEQDGKNTTGDLVLDSIDLALLAELGDDPAFRSGIFIPLENNYEGLVKYSLDNNVLSYAPDLPDESGNARGANFSLLEGDLAAYEIDTDAGANGRVYEYVGAGNGSFGPWLPIATPEKKQLITAGINYRVRDSTALYLETGMSNNDLNRFSTVDSEDDIGRSLYASFSDSRKIFKKKKKIIPEDSTLMAALPTQDWVLTTAATLERISEEFKSLNPYRVAEFKRDWDTGSLLEKSAQSLYKITTAIENGQMGLFYELNGFNAKNQYDGLKNILGIKANTKGWNVNGEYNLLNYETADINGEFFRPKMLISKQIGYLNLGAYYEKERNTREDVSTDSLQRTSFNYDMYKAMVSTDENRLLHFNAAYIRRHDDAVFENKLTPVSVSDDYSVGGGWRAAETSNLKWQVTYRDYENLGVTEEREASKKSLIGLVNHKLALWNRGVLVDSYLESNSGQEPKIEFQYIEVQRGEGSYVWNDWNQDSLQQINEFDIAPLSDLANYERISVFNNEFIGTNKTVFNTVLRLNPKKIWKEQKKFINRFQSTIRHQVDQRQLSQGSQSLIPKFRSNLLDTNLVSYNATTDASLFFDRGNVKRDVQVTYRNLSNKVQQITGYEVRTLREYYAKVRLNLTKPIDFVLESRVGEKIADSELFEMQRYTIDFWKLIPQLNFRPSQKLRLITKYSFGTSNNQIGDMEISKNRDLGVELTWRKSSTSNLQFQFNWVNIEYDGNRNTPVEFEMLQGLRPGSNYLWLVNYTRRLSQNFDLIINYNGRKSKDTRLVNTAGVQLRAIF